MICTAPVLAVNRLLTTTAATDVASSGSSIHCNMDIPLDPCDKIPAALLALAWMPSMAMSTLPTVMPLGNVKMPFAPNSQTWLSPEKSVINCTFSSPYVPRRTQ